VDISAGRTATKDTGAALDKQAEAPAVRQVESSRNDGKRQQPETELVVPQKTAAGSRVRVILLIALLVVSAGFFALRRDKWRAWQNEITNWWAGFSVVQVMPQAPSSEPKLDERLFL
jgi:hypothetical protein